jgi:hypothetical protein
MNILDENIPENQCDLLRSRRVRFRQIGQDIGREGVKDPEIISLLHQCDRPTLFTRDSDFYKRRLCHDGYCLVHLAVEDEAVAEFICRVLRHPELNSKAKRMGLVIRASPSGLTVWRIHEDQEQHLAWE